MQKLHLDTDIAGDIDDLCALAMLLNWPDLEIVAVTTCAEDRGGRAGYARYALQLAGHADVPVAAGSDIALGCYRVTPGLHEEARFWPEPVPPAPGPLDKALDLLERSIDQGVTIAAVGPYTNLALLEKRSHGILRRAKLCLMGGYIFPPRKGFPEWDAKRDWNVQVDAQSALTVFRNSNPTLVPITITAETWLRRSDIAALERGGPLARILARQAVAYGTDNDTEARYGKTCASLPDDILNFQHDPLACAIALGWNDGVEIRDLPVKAEIVDGWLYQVIDDCGVPTRVVARADGAKFSQFWLEMVTGETPAGARLRKL